MNEKLPEGWIVTRVSDCFESWGGCTPSTSKPEYWNGDIPWISSKDIKQWRLATGTDFVTAKATSENRLRMCPSGNVLVVVRSGILAHTLPVAVTQAPVVINQDVKAFDSRDRTLNAWLALSLRALTQEILNESRKDGTTVHSIAYPRLRNLALPVPPLAEQQRIVAQVEALLARVNAARERLAKVPAILKRFRQSVLAAACSGRLTEEWRDLAGGVTSKSDVGGEQQHAHGRYDHAKPVWRDDLEAFELPQAWLWVDLRSLVNEREAFCYGVVQPGADDPGGVLLVRAGDLENGTVALSNLRRVPVDVDSQYERSRLRGGELLITVVGAGIGNAAIAPDSCAGFNIARAIAKVPVRQAYNRYIYHWLTTSNARAWMKGDSREVARPTLNLEQLVELPVPLPPVAEQHEIVRRVDALFKLADAMQRRVVAATGRAEKLTQAILAKAFRGELVPTEAELARREGRGYEPAAVLLERIRAQRPNQAPVPRPHARRIRQVGDAKARTGGAKPAASDKQRKPRQSASR